MWSVTSLFGLFTCVVCDVDSQCLIYNQLLQYFIVELTHIKEFLYHIVSIMLRDDIIVPFLLLGGTVESFWMLTMHGINIVRT